MMILFYFLYMSTNFRQSKIIKLILLKIAYIQEFIILIANKILFQNITIMQTTPTSQSYKTKSIFFQNQFYINVSRAILLALLVCLPFIYFKYQHVFLEVKLDQLEYSINDFKYLEADKKLKIEQISLQGTKNNLKTSQTYQKSLSTSQGQLKSSEQSFLTNLQQNQNIQNNQRLLENTDSNSSNANNTNTVQQNQVKKAGVQQYILLMIIIFFVCIPAITIIIVVVSIVVKKCRGQNPNAQNQQERQEDQTARAQNQQNQRAINLDQYKIDEIGPYMTNPEDQCSICLDKSANLRTFCGHLFHASCLRKWFTKKVRMGRNYSCPVCVSEVTNPVKIYCKACHIGVRLDILSVSTSRTVLTQYDAIRCDQCQKQQTQNENKTQQKSQINKEQILNAPKNQDKRRQIKQHQQSFPKNKRQAQQKRLKQQQKQKKQDIHRIQNSKTNDRINLQSSEAININYQI